jgi:hypothetical protein
MPAPTIKTSNMALLSKFKSCPRLTKIRGLGKDSSDAKSSYAG